MRRQRCPASGSGAKLLAPVGLRKAAVPARDSVYAILD